MLVAIKYHYKQRCFQANLLPRNRITFGFQYIFYNAPECTGVFDNIFWQVLKCLIISEHYVWSEFYEFYNMSKF